MHKAIMANEELKILEIKINSLITLLEKVHPQLESWLYLLHHIQVDEKGDEELHHCFVIDHLGNLYEIDHMKDEKGIDRHYIVGLKEDQNVYWSDMEAIEDGNEVPCANRQLES